MKGKIIQDAKLYLQKEGEEKIRHIKTWDIYKIICKELGISTDYHERTFVEKLPPIGRPITEWPEEETEYKVGPKRIFFCVHENCDFQDIKDVGGTLIQTYGIQWLPDEGQDFLDKAWGEDEKMGLKVLYSIKSQVHDLLRVGKPWNKEECERLVNKFKDHSALWGWLILDEPDAGVDHPAAGVSMELQQEIHDAFREWTDKPLVIFLRGGTVGWHLIDFRLWKILPDSYVFDGTDDCWGMKPLAYLDMLAKQERVFMDEHEVDYLGFVFQSSSHMATSIGNYGTKIPLGEIENQFNVLQKYGLFPEGVGMYGWNGGDYDPMREEELRLEIRELFEKIK